MRIFLDFLMCTPRRRYTQGGYTQGGGNTPRDGEGTPMGRYTQGGTPTGWGTPGEGEGGVHPEVVSK